MALIRLQHIGAAVASYERAAAALTRKGLTPRDFRNDQGRGFQHDARVLLGNECWLHVVHNWNPESRVGRFLASHGPGLEHIALESNDIEADVGRLRELGVPIFEDHVFDANDGYEAFVYPDDAIGFTVELIQPHSHSWGYPEEARGEPVSAKLGRARLVEVAARVDDVASATERFERLFGVKAPRVGWIELGNTSLSLHPAGGGEPSGLVSMTLEVERVRETDDGSELELDIELTPALYY